MAWASCLAVQPLPGVQTEQKKTFLAGLMNAEAFLSSWNGQRIGDFLSVTRTSTPPARATSTITPLRIRLPLSISGGTALPRLVPVLLIPSFSSGLVPAADQFLAEERCRRTV